MRKLVLAMAAFGLVLFSWERVQADHQGASSPCCQAKPCDDPEGDGVCNNLNGGMACNEADPAAPSGASGGCAEAPTGSCAGGDAQGASGCICLGSGGCVDSTGPITDEACRDAAVDACCASGVCH